MKISLSLTIALILLATPALADQKVYDQSQSIIVPKYIVKDRADGSKAVYDSRHPVLPLYHVKPSADGKTLKVYDVNKSVVIPKFIVEGGNSK